ncbi:hypothetical protein HOY80DRAFT_1040187 [Tuber brumale]|nr:hypothetical protein HOY80DRAFT_1040187 [Tuber brumale]
MFGPCALLLHSTIWIHLTLRVYTLTTSSACICFHGYQAKQDSNLGPEIIAYHHASMNGLESSMSRMLASFPQPPIARNGPQSTPDHLLESHVVRPVTHLGNSRLWVLRRGTLTSSPPGPVMSAWQNPLKAAAFQLHLLSGRDATNIGIKQAELDNLSTEFGGISTVPVIMNIPNAF